MGLVFLCGWERCYRGRVLVDDQNVIAILFNQNENMQGLFVYWTANNFLSVMQTVVMKKENVRKFFDIPAPPPAAVTPALKMVNPMKSLFDVSSCKLSM